MSGLCPRGLCAFCDRGPVAGVVLWWCGESARSVVLGASGWPPSHGASPRGTGRRPRGDEPTPEPLTAEVAALPLALGADGVMVPFRPDAGAPQGRIRWREVKVGVLARIGQHRTRTARWSPG